MNKLIVDLADEVVQLFLHLYGEEKLVCPHCGSIITDALFIYQFLLLQNFYDRLFFITSYYRCPEYNEQIGGARYSRHIRGRAIDILPPDEKIQDFIWHCKEVGMTTILYYPGKKIFHIDNVGRGFYVNLNYKR
jgi:hypothetical protein